MILAMLPGENEPKKRKGLANLNAKFEAKKSVQLKNNPQICKREKDKLCLMR